MDSLKELEQKQKPSATSSQGTGAQHYAQQKQDRALQKRLSQLEKKISQLEKEIKSLDVALEVDYDATVADPSFFDHYQVKKKDLEVLLQEWEKVQTEMD